MGGFSKLGAGTFGCRQTLERTGSCSCGGAARRSSAPACLYTCAAALLAARRSKTFLEPSAPKLGGVRVENIYSGDFQQACRFFPIGSNQWKTKRVE